MLDFEPKFITFDCYGTLVNFRLSELARDIYADRLEKEALDRFVVLLANYRRDEVLGPWKPYRDVLLTSTMRACRRMDIGYAEADALRLYDAIPGFAPHPDVPEGLRRLAAKYKLVALSNASDDQIHLNIAQLGAPFHAVFTAQQAQSYKPRMRGFEYMFEQLDCEPEEVFHVSASLRYDLMTADDLGIRHKAFVNRGLDIPNPAYNYHEVRTIGEIASLFGL